ncbi:MAG TPA: DPP IV N-terminal domain-containing protein, partial [Balneolaceae bacterium]|nr:DPP IV N-terminal domain-containing protein [Balneolaceae bacterium]
MKKIFLVLICFGWIVQPTFAQKKELTFDQVVDGTFYPEGIRDINWMRDGQYYTTLERTDHDIQIRRYNIVTGDYKVLAASSQLFVPGRNKPVIIQGYQFSADEKKILIKTDVEPIWRHSTREHYFVYNLATKKIQRLTDSKAKKQYAHFSPSGDKVAYVQDNDLYIVNLD